RVEIPDVAAHADVRAEERDQPSANVPCGLILVVRLTRAVDGRSHQSDTREAVRLDGTDLRRQHEVAHEGQHVGRFGRRRAEEVVRVRELGFEADEAAERAERDAPVDVFVLAVGYLRTSRITAEVVPDERTDESLRVRPPADA